MAYSSLKRKTPLKVKVGFKARQSLQRKPKAQQPAKERKGRHTASERPRTPRKPTKSSLELRLDVYFSMFIRLRDAMDGGMTRCISCGRVLPFREMQCGHFFGRRNMSTRWDEDNCNSECEHCNCKDDHHLEGYRRNLIRKIGEERFAMLEARHNEERKWTEAELREAIAHYTAEVRRLSKEKGIAVRV